MNELDQQIIITNEDVLEMLDEMMEKRDAMWWNQFYDDPSKPIPFFKVIPDINLVHYVNEGLIHKGKVLDIGCGNGRNAIYLAKQGFEVDAIDFSVNSINWAKENAKKDQVTVNFICDSIFNTELEYESYDFIYDSGLFHHIKPHRREQFFHIITHALKANGRFGLSCLNLKAGANVSDYQVYNDKSMHGGLGFSEYKLKAILDYYFSIIEFKEMERIEDPNYFGLDILWNVLTKKK